MSRGSGGGGWRRAWHPGKGAGQVLGESVRHGAGERVSQGAGDDHAVGRADAAARAVAGAGVPALFLGAHALSYHQGIVVPHIHREAEADHGAAQTQLEDLRALESWQQVLLQAAPYLGRFGERMMRELGEVHAGRNDSSPTLNSRSHLILGTHLWPPKIPSSKSQPETLIRRLQASAPQTPSAPHLESERPEETPPLQVGRTARLLARGGQDHQVVIFVLNFVSQLLHGSTRQVSLSTLDRPLDQRFRDVGKVGQRPSVEVL